MENFTDIFGEDLAGLEDLGNLGNFAGGGGEMGNGAPGQQTQQPQMDPAMLGHGAESSNQFSQQQRHFQQQQQHSQKMPSGYGDFNAYGAGTPSQYGYSNGPGQGQPGYPPNPGSRQGFSGPGAPQGMMSGGPGGPQSYPGYPPSQGGMAWQQSAQAMQMGGPRMYGQPGYPPSGPGMPGSKGGNKSLALVIHATGDFMDRPVILQPGGGRQGKKHRDRSGACILEGAQSNPPSKFFFGGSTPPLPKCQRGGKYPPARNLTLVMYVRCPLARLL